MNSTLDFTSKEYLPNSEERIEHLREIIDGRPVAILAAGPSIYELEKRIGELRHADICYFGFNRFVQEKHILQQIDKHLSVFMNSTREHLYLYIQDIINFLNRDEDNMFVSTFYRDPFELIDNDFDLKQFLSKYDKKLLFFNLRSDRTLANRNLPLHFIGSNSLQIIIQLAVIGKASRIVLFGADGGCCKENSKEHHYCQSEYKPFEPFEEECEGLVDAAFASNTNEQFNPTASIAIRNTYKTYNLPPIDILNCSENSLYTPFPTISYDDAFEILLTGKKFDRKMDLRVPKVSVISPVVNTGGSFRETVESISNQSYSNLEHIVVYSEANDEMQERMRRFPYTKWSSEKELGYLPALIKGISQARGEYIFHCRIGNRYINQDWINTCVEVLENNNNISLVWGLSQNQSEDGALRRIADAHFFDSPSSQGKDFIYFWLKKKILFPEGNFCVRKKVLEECFPLNARNVVDEREGWLVFNYRFNTSGYLPYFVPIVANYCGIKSDVEGQNADLSTQKWMRAYHEDIKQYKRKLIMRKTAHHYRNGSCELLPDGFNRCSFLIFDISRYIKGKLLKQPFVKKALQLWRAYRWAVFKLGAVKVWQRLTRK